jgi:peptidoglycan/LPS O-acetylase OafA/YrhL
MSATAGTAAAPSGERPSPAEGARPKPAPRPAPFHIPSLDGLRAVSFFMVFAAHAGLDWIVPGGFGVTVFFFLSGYLITTLMRLEHEKTGTVGLKGFYLRRVLRILPPFYLVLILAGLLTLAGVVPGTLRPRAVLAQYLHYSNYWFVGHGAEGVPAGTVVYWSLAVEEHYYFIFPLLYLMLRRAGLSGRAQGWVLWSLCAGICLWRCVLVAHGVSMDRTYLASDTRFDSILFGCALAVAANPMIDARSGSDALWKRGLLPLGVAVLLFTFLFRAPWFRETLRYTLQGIALTPLFVAAMRFPGWGPMRILNWRPLAFVGALSYSLYLIHHVVLYTVQFHLPGWNPVLQAALAFAVAFGLSLASYRFVEKPCARLRKRLSSAA